MSLDVSGRDTPVGNSEIHCVIHFDTLSAEMTCPLEHLSMTRNGQGNSLSGLVLDTSYVCNLFFSGVKYDFGKMTGSLNGFNEIRRPP